MTPKKLLTSARAAVRVARQHGLLEVGILTLQRLQALKAQAPGKGQPLSCAPIYDELLATDLTRPANQDWAGCDKEHLAFNWLMPPPGKGSGGHINIFRFVQHLERAGHTCRMYFHSPAKGSTVKAVKDSMGNGFPKVAAEMQWLWPGQRMADADAIFATSWQTAYPVYCSTVNAKKLYFVQDFEPYFYPMGSTYLFAEDTYRLGLHGITAGGWLKSILSEKYGMVSDSFDLSADPDVYRFEGRPDRKAVLFYARSFTERRAFDLGILALDLFHRRHPDYEFFFVGEDVSSFALPFPHKNLGILTPRQLNDLYNRCSAALVLSMTNASMLPLELLSAGCIPVVNDGDNNRLVLANDHVDYRVPHPVALANGLHDVVTDPNLVARSRAGADSVKSRAWEPAIETATQAIVQAVRTKG